VFFDGNVMTRTGTFRGVPLYQDRTIEPYSIVYVPVGQSVMRPYERRREGVLAGTTGSRTPSFPAQRDVELSAASGAAGFVVPRIELVETPSFAEAERFTAQHVMPAAPSSGAAVGTAGGAAAGSSPVTEVVPQPAAPPTPRATSNDGVWIDFGGARWFASGRAESFSPDRFSPAGEYRGFPVYRTRDSDGTIYVPTVHDGALTPYTRK
jgi:hypothetical protein